jgi:hypothetical protein
VAAAARSAKVPGQVAAEVAEAAPMTNRASIILVIPLSPTKKSRFCDFELSPKKSTKSSCFRVFLQGSAITPQTGSAKNRVGSRSGFTK